MQTLQPKPTAKEEHAPAAAPPYTTRRLAPQLRGDMAIAVLVLSPSIIAVALFIYSFIGWTFYISTVNWNDVLPDYTFVGLRNWLRLFRDERFQTDLRNLVFYAVPFMAQCIVGGFLLAALLDQHIKGEALFRTVFIFPFAVSGIVTGVAWRWLMQPETGINLLFDAVGLGFLKSQWYASPDYGMFAVTIPAAWQMTGYIMALYLASLRGIPIEVREAAHLDGCGTFALYRHVIIPLLAPVTFTAVVLTGMNAIRVFDLVAAMGGSGAAYATDTLAFYMFQMTFQSNRFSLGAALAAFMIILSAFLVVPYLRSIRHEVE
ncbi:MAG TPA: sugar ABC transporter permease [Roseiflexaceae bacterium]|nr:sugar ABC transporter permease [Roseiflexaceae bacterium]